MDLEAATPLAIDVAGSNEQLVALGLVFARYSEELRWELVQRVLEQSRAGELSLDSLIVARRAGHIVGAGWLQTMAGKVAMIWPPQLARDETSNTATEMLSRMDKLAIKHDLRLLQAFVFPRDEHSAMRLADAGFQSESELLVYACESDQLAREPSIGPLEFEPFTQSQRDRLEKLIEQTYIQSLDCPKLSGVRDISDVVDGHQAAGEFDPAHWFFVRYDNRDVGCLLLAEHPRDNQFELVYMGLVSSARGNGWGKLVARHAQWLTRQAGRDKAILAVDVRNLPAICTYESAAFERRDSRRVFLKIIAKVQVGTKSGGKE